MILVKGIIHEISGKPIGIKIWCLRGLPGTTVTITRHIYANIVKVDGRLVNLGA